MYAEHLWLEAARAQDRHEGLGVEPRQEPGPLPAEPGQAWKEMKGFLRLLAAQVALGKAAAFDVTPAAGRLRRSPQSRIR